MFFTANFLRKYSLWFGLSGVVILQAAVLISAAFYQGRKGESFSMLNHFVSELGELAVSPLAWVFNGGLLLASFCYLLFIASLAPLLPTLRGKLALYLGLSSCLASMAVALFPMDFKMAHAIAALLFFLLDLLGALFFSFAASEKIQGGKALPRASAFFGIPIVLSFVFVFVILFLNYENALKIREAFRSPESFQRPAVLPVAIGEWLVFWSTQLWFLGMSALMYKRAV